MTEKRIFLKLRGSFVKEGPKSIPASKQYFDSCLQKENLVTEVLFAPSFPGNSFQRKINTSQLNQSRFGLLSQAFMLFIVIGFLFSEILEDFWKTK